MMEAERHSWILAYLENREFLSVGEAIRRLQASPSTIRRDFLELTSRNLVERTRGGIKRSDVDSVGVLPFDLREIKHAREKDAIARRAAQLLRDGDAFIVDGGTTTYQMAAHIPSVRLSLITISIPLLMALSKRSRELQSLEILMTGGVYNSSMGILLGADVQGSLSKMHAQWAFLAIDGVTEQGLTNTNYLSTASKIEMIRNSEKVVVLADHSKIGRRAMAQVCGLEEIDILITDDSKDNAPVLDKIRKAGVEVITVSPGD